MNERLCENTWESLCDFVGGRAGCELTEALRDLYSIYDKSIVEWFANLYDPKIGGYYYSNSARDNEPFRPDSESTLQALAVITRSGMAGKGRGYHDVIPEWMKKQLIRFIKGLQDPNGFFYHPQWDRAETDRNISRRGRDLMWSTAILRTLGSAPTYDAPNGAKGDGILPDGSRVEPADTRKEDKGDAAPTAKNEANEACAPHFESRESYIAYLDGLLAEKRSLSFYSIGNQLIAEMPQLLRRDELLSESGADYRFKDILIEWLNAHQNPETGHWEKDNNGYLGVNGLLKIACIYNDAAAELPYADRAAESAIAAIILDEPIGAVVDIYNTWFAVQLILKNMRAYGSSSVIDGVMLDGNARADRTVRNLRAIAAPAIRKTKEKILRFKKPDGSFSYCPDYPAPTSQGMYVCIAKQYEGDVNASNISTTGLVGFIYEALELIDHMVPLFGKEELELYLSILDRNARAAGVLVD